MGKEKDGSRQELGDKLCIFRQSQIIAIFHFSIIMSFRDLVKLIAPPYPTTE